MKLLANCVLAGIILAGASVKIHAAELTDISNFREYSSTFASSGQPTEAELKLLAEEGYERIVYIAFTNSRDAIAEEDAIVKELGMDYVHVPVIWDAPTAADFYAFAAVMQRDPGLKSLLHCQVNYRASAFSFLYRVLHEGTSIEDAKADMNSVWQPNETWRDLIFTILADNDVDPNCAGCDWTPGE